MSPYPEMPGMFYSHPLRLAHLCICAPGHLGIRLKRDFSWSHIFDSFLLPPCPTAFTYSQKTTRILFPSAVLREPDLLENWAKVDVGKCSVNMKKLNFLVIRQKLPNIKFSFADQFEKFIKWVFSWLWGKTLTWKGYNLILIL